jgi:Glucodextranase, domain B
MKGFTLIACAIVGFVACGDNTHPPFANATLATLAPATVQAGDVIAITCVLTENGSAQDVDDATIDVVDESAVLRMNGDIVARKAGLITVTCELPDDGLASATPAIVTIVPGPPASLVTTITPDPATAGDTVVATCEVFDAMGNGLSNQSPTLAITPTDPNNTITGLSAVMTRSGHYDGECALPGATSNDAGFDVLPGLPASLLLGKQPDQPYYSIGDDIAITSVVSDRYGNQVPNATVNVTSTVLTGTGTITEPSVGTFSYSGEGKYEVDGTVAGLTDGGSAVTASTDIFIDELGPKIACNGPTDGSMVTSSGTITFNGLATDVNGTQAVAINGTPVTLDANGTFSAPIATQFGINFVSVTATDTFSVQSTKICTFLASQQWANPNATYAGVIGLSLSQAGIDDGNRSGAINSLADLLYTILNSTGIRTTINTALEASNPLASGCAGVTLFGDCIGVSYTITFTGSTIDGPNTVALTLENGGIGTTATINGVHLDLNIGGFGTSGTVDVSSITVGLELVPAVSGGVPHVTVANVSTSVGNVSTNFSGITGAIINIIADLAEGTLKSEVQSLVQNFVTNNFGTAIDGIVSGLDISSLASSFNVPKLYGGGSVALNFGLAFSSISTTTSRLEFGIGTELTGPVANAYSTLGVAVPTGTVLGDPSTSPGDMAVTLNVAMINQALHALWRANWLTATIPATTINSGAPADLEIQLDARLPPVADILADGTVEISLGDIDLALTGDSLPAGLVITIGGRAHTSVAINGTNLSFGTITLDDLEVSLDALGLSAASEQQLQTLIASALPQLLGGSLQNALPSFPIPSFPIPASLSAYGLPGGSTLSINGPVLQASSPWLFLRGQFGIN